jgi:hypothetical protein
MGNHQQLKREFVRELDIDIRNRCANRDLEEDED